MADIQIVGAVLDTENLTLYKPDGEKIIIKQGDRRVKPILDHIMPIIKAGGVATITDETLNNYAGFEKKTGIKLFKVLKSAVASIFNRNREEEAEHLAPTSVGKVPGAPVAPTQQQQAATAQTAKQVDAVMEKTVAKAAEPKPSPARVPQLGAGLLSPANNASEGFSGDLKEDETLVAVVGDTVIPGVEALKGQFDHVARGDNPEGLKRLLERLAVMIHDREHSVEDILRFLERGDLPIADDGSIIAYKVLRFSDRAKGIFVDCHTGKVTQRVGSYVVVDEKLVDKNRRNECSNGLHIARRGYIGGFSGDLCVLCKIDPEDIITVPHNDPNKVRVCGYHILGILDDEDFRLLKQNKPMTSTKTAQVMLAKALVGDHIGRIEEVRVTQQRGGGLQITPMQNGKKVASAPISTEHRKAAAIDDMQAHGTDPKSVAKQMRETKPAAPAPVVPAKVVSTEAKASGARAQLAASYHREMNDTSRAISDRQKSAQKLLDLKKKGKVGWSKLGLSDDTPKHIETIMALPIVKETLPKPSDTKASADKPKSQGKAPAKPEVKKASEANFKKATAKPVETTKIELPKSSRQSQASRLYERMNNPALTLKARQQTAKELKEFKSKAKVSWIALGLQGDVGDQITKLLDQKSK